MWWLAWVALVVLAAVVVYDLIQAQHAILRNFPIIGHFRYWLEAIGPELRQYIVTDNDEERPFSRDQRRWIYASAKQENNYFGFGTDNDLELTPNYLIIKHSAFPLPEPHRGDPWLRPCLSHSLRQGDGRRAWASEGVSPGVCGQHFRHELWLAQFRCSLGHQSSLPTGGLPAKYGGGRHCALPPDGRRSRLADRHGLLWLPGVGRAL